MSFILSDVDGVIVDYYGNPRLETIDLLWSFHALDFELVIWSGGYAGYPREIADRFNLPVKRTFKKPDYPIQLGAALELLGGVPALQLDDDPTERVADWPFIHIPCDDGTMPGRTARVE